MALTREAYETVVMMYFDYHWTVAMIWPHLNLKPWEVEEIISTEEAKRRPQLELFQPKDQRAA